MTDKDEYLIWANEILHGPGYVLLPGFFDPSGLLELVSDIVDDYVHEHGPDRVYSGGYRPDVMRETEVQALMLDPRLLGIASRVLGSRPAFGSLGCNSVPPGSSGMEPHFDYPYFAMPPAALPGGSFPALCLQVIWYLTDVGKDQGPTVVVPGSQRRPMSPGPRFYDESRKVTAQAGTVFVGHGALWHGVAPNSSKKVRHAILGSYVPFWVHPMTTPSYELGHSREMQELMRSDFARRIGEGYEGTVATSRVQPVLERKPVSSDEHEGPRRIVAFVNRDGVTFARKDGSHRLYLAGDGGWASLNPEQRDSVCRVVCAVKSGDFEVEESAIGGQDPPVVHAHRVD